MKLAQRQSIEKIKVQLRAHVVELLEKLGFDFSNAICDEFEIRGEAICHGGDNSSGFVYYQDSGVWRCWTSNCHVDSKEDLLGLIMASRNIKFYSAISWAKRFLETIKIDDNRVHEILSTKGKRISSVKDPDDMWKIHISQKVHSPTLLSSLRTPTVFCRSRGLDSKLCMNRGIGYAEKGKLCGRIVVPIYNAVGKIVGFSGRIVKSSQSKHKWNHWPSAKLAKFNNETSFKPGINLYNINFALKNLIGKENRTIILTEGPFDVIKLIMAGFDNSVCVFGSSLSNAQVALMKKCGIENIILAFDGDKAGQKANDKAHDLLSHNIINSYIINLGHSDDVGSMEPKVIKKLFGDFCKENKI